MDKDELYMHRCLELAKLAAGNVAPNPMVGAILVHDGKIISEGYHKNFGGAHAEVDCINNIKEDHKNLIENSTLYVSLEPCSHVGKTPPCADLIIKNKIPRVVIGCTDIYKEVAGKGIKKLEEAGIEVITGILEKESVEINKRFFTFHQKQRPYIILKWAQSTNRKIGIDAGRVLISNDYTNRLVHKWRSEEAGILVGRKTALKDDPSLTTRLYPGNNPVRCVTDNDLTLPTWLTLFDNSTPTIVFNLLKEAKDKNIKWVRLKDSTISTLLTAMHHQFIQSVIVEGGATLLQSFIDAQLWDEARIICNEQLLIEKGIDAPQLKNAILQKQENFSTDTVSYFLPSS